MTLTKNNFKEWFLKATCEHGDEKNWFSVLTDYDNVIEVNYEEDEVVVPMSNENPHIELTQKQRKALLDYVKDWDKKEFHDLSEEEQRKLIEEDDNFRATHLFI